jgi:recombinational DNA repair protein (RecF pathway)
MNFCICCGTNPQVDGPYCNGCTHEEGCPTCAKLEGKYYKLLPLEEDFLLDQRKECQRTDYER